MARKALYQGREYVVVNPPRPDDHETCEFCDRLMLYHVGQTGGHRQACCENGTHLLVAPRGVLTAGWVIGEFWEDAGDSVDRADAYYSRRLGF